MVAVLVRLLNWADRRAGCCAHLGNETGHARAHAGATPAGLAGAASLGRRACGAGHAGGAGLVAGVVAAVSVGAGVPAAEPSHPPWAVPGQAAHGAASATHRRRLVRTLPDGTQVGIGDYPSRDACEERRTHVFTLRQLIELRCVEEKQP